MFTVTSPDGTAIAYERTGDGPPLVLVHGTAGHRIDWREVAPELAESFTLYVVERRGADSAGHRKVFDDPADLRRLYERLPARFTAEEVTAAGVSGPRRHLLVRHVAEHPGFDCDLVSRQPLTVQKRESSGRAATPDDDPAEVTAAARTGADD